MNEFVLQHFQLVPHELIIRNQSGSNVFGINYYNCYCTNYYYNCCKYYYKAIANKTTTDVENSVNHGK